MKKHCFPAILVVAASLASPSAVGKEKPSYQKGLLLQMESVSCGYQQKGGKGITGAILGTDSQEQKTREMLCQEYVLRSARIIYRIRPKDEKNPVLLPVGDEVEFRIDKDKLRLRDPEGDGKEREYYVISMTPRGDLRDSKNEPCPPAKQ